MSLELLRVEFRIVGLVRDPDGGIVGERHLADGVAYPAGLDDLAASVRRTVEDSESSPNPLP